MTDLALYRAVESVGGRIAGVSVSEETGAYQLEVHFAQDVDTLYRAEVNRLPSPAVDLLSPRRARVTVPVELEKVSVGALSVVCQVDASLASLERGPVPASIGWGLRVSLYDGELQALQKAVRTLLMSPGTDSWDRSRGGGLRQIKGTLVDPSDTSRLVRTVQVAIDRFNATTAARRARSNRGGTPRAYVSKMELLSVRVMSRAYAEIRHLHAAADVGEQLVATGGFDPNDVVILVSIGHDLRDPSGNVVRVSSAVSV